MFLMWGYEGEELQDIEATIEHVKRSDPDIFFTTVAYPIKGTPYFKSVSDRLIQLKPWAKSSDRELEVSGRRPRAFYECVDRLLRDEVALARLLRGKSTESLNPDDLRRRIQNARAEVCHMMEAAA
jgi:anaerobic magnesium-protoporphyrin IX monomethyl ester cyclase